MALRAFPAASALSSRHAGASAVYLRVAPPVALLRRPAAAPGGRTDRRPGPLPRAVRADQAAPVEASDVQLIADVTRDVDARLAAALGAAAEAALGTPPPPASELRARLAATIRRLEAGLLERETEVRAGGRGAGQLGRWRGAVLCLQAQSPRNHPPRSRLAAQIPPPPPPPLAPGAHPAALAPPTPSPLHPRHAAGAPAHAGRALRRALAAARPPGHRQVGAVAPPERRHGRHIL